MNNKSFVNKALDIANNYNTAYVWGTFGLVANAANMQRMINQYSKNNSYLERAKKIYGNGYYFDCVGLIKGILWGWCGNASATYGGAKYASNGVPDISADGMISICTNVSSDFSYIEIGEAVWLSGHIGIYVGNGKVVEATPAWTGGVQVSDISSTGKRTKNGSGTAYWKKHGKLPFLTYESSSFTWTEEKVNLTGTVTASTLNIRQKPTTDSTVIGKHANGDVVNISAKTDNSWYKVSYPNIGIGYISSEYVKTVKNSFPDISGHYAEQHIKKLFSYGIANGYEDGTFKPDNAITRAEFAALTANALEKIGYSLKTSPGFADTAGHWAEKSVCKLVACGIVHGFEDGTFKPDLKITRGQAAIMASNMLVYCGVAIRDGDDYPDTASHYASRHIKSLRSFGVVNGYEDGTFKPDNEITRGQAAMYISNCLTVLGK